MDEKQFFKHSEIAAYRRLAIGALAASGAGVLALAALGTHSSLSRAALFSFIVSAMPAGFCVVTEADRLDSPVMNGTQAMIALFFAAVGYLCLILHIDWDIVFYAFPIGAWAIILTHWAGRRGNAHRSHRAIVSRPNAQPCED